MIDNIFDAVLSCLLLGIPKTTVHYMVKDLESTAYHMHIGSSFTDAECDNRKSTCMDLKRYFNSNPDLVNNIVFCGEATFYVSGYVAKHNCKILGLEKPTSFSPAAIKTEKVIVWCGLARNGVFGPLFFREPMSDDNYLSLLQDCFIPSLNKEQLDTIVFQHDDAPIHDNIHAKLLLDRIFSKRWIGVNGPMRWPSKSPDLSPCDFFLWGYIKTTLAAKEYNSLSQLEKCIDEICKNIAAKRLRKVFDAFTNRINQCIEIDGKAIPQLSARQR